MVWPTAFLCNQRFKSKELKQKHKKGTKTDYNIVSPVKCHVLLDIIIYFFFSSMDIVMKLVGGHLCFSQCLNRHWLVKIFCNRI